MDAINEYIDSEAGDVLLGLRYMLRHIHSGHIDRQVYVNGRQCYGDTLGRYARVASQEVKWMYSAADTLYVQFRLGIMEAQYQDSSESLGDFLDDFLEGDLDTFIMDTIRYEELREMIRDNMDMDGYCTNIDDRMIEIEPDMDEERLNDLLPDGVEGVSDGSVSGPEIRTIGPNTASRFIECLRDVTGLQIEVDTGCSFHIHLSVPGIQHSYGEQLQLAMYEYLLMNTHRLPDSVIHRWAASSKRDRYYQLRLSKEKFSFVHFHQAQRTWEFRCFGNVSEHDDGVKCLRLAVEALQYAYKISLGQPRELDFTIEEGRHFLDQLNVHDKRTQDFHRFMRLQRVRIRRAA
jgi:hypothetical protein